MHTYTSRCCHWPAQWIWLDGSLEQALPEPPLRSPVETETPLIHFRRRNSWSKSAPPWTRLVSNHRGNRNGGGDSANSERNVACVLPLSWFMLRRKWNCQKYPSRIFGNRLCRRSGHETLNIWIRIHTQWWCGNVIKLQVTIVSLSAMQSEYIVASESTREAIWLRWVADCLPIWESLRLDWMFYAATTKNPLVLAYNHLAHKGSKHIEVRYHFVREQVASGII